MKCILKGRIGDYMLKDLFCVVGLGQAGGKMTKEFYNNKYRTFLINTSYQDLEVLNVKNDLMYHIPSAHGCAKIRERAIEYAKEYYEDIIGKLLDTHPTARIFLVHFSLGGGTGGGLANILMSLLHHTLTERGITDFTIIPVGAKPKKYESYKIQMNSIQCLKEMYSLYEDEIIGQYYIIDNDSRNDLDEINEENALLFDRWIQGELTNNDNNADESERTDLFSCRGSAMMFQFDGKDIENFSTNMKEEYEKSIYYIASKKPSSVGMALNDNLEQAKAFESIEETVGYYSNNHITPTKESNMLMICGIEDEIPSADKSDEKTEKKRKIINDIQKIANEKAEKINGGNNIDEVEEVIAVDINNTKSTSTKENKSPKKNISYKDIMDRFK